MAKCRITREVDIDELREILSLMEVQETTDKEVNTSIHIDGNDAVIDVVIDEYGNVVVE